MDLVVQVLRFNERTRNSFLDVRTGLLTMAICRVIKFHTAIPGHQLHGQGLALILSSLKGANQRDLKRAGGAIGVRGSQ